MIGEQFKHYQGKNADLNSLKSKIAEYLTGDGFKVQSSIQSPRGAVIQAQKDGLSRHILAADQVFTVLIAGQPGDFTIRVGIGKWVKNLEVTTVEDLLLSDLFILVDAPETVWSLNIENKILTITDSFVT